MVTRMMALTAVALAALLFAVTGCGSAEEGEAPRPTAAPAAQVQQQRAAEPAPAPAAMAAPTAAPAAPRAAAAPTQAPAMEAPAPAAAPQPPAPAAPAPAAPAVGSSPGATTFQDTRRTPPVTTAQDRVSTFSLDTDRTSYRLALSWAREGYQVEPDSVRAEEWVNSFYYGYPQPTSSHTRWTAVFTWPASDSRRHSSRTTGL